ncbi:unnamed protein product [Calypogeia fissa]
MEETRDPEVRRKELAKEVSFKELAKNESSDKVDEGNRDGQGKVQLSNDHSSHPGEPDLATRLTENNFQLAIYIAMAHAGLALVVLIIYGLGRLLKDVWEPIQWAVLCSMPLREVQEALVTFWKEPLRQGLVESVVAAPIALYKALVGTLLDAREGALRFVGKGHSFGDPRPVGFAKLFQWLVAFGFFTLGLDIFGPANLSLVAFVGLLMYAGGTGFEVSQLTTAFSQNGRLRRDDGELKGLNWVLGSITRASRSANQKISRSLIPSLHTLVATGLITTMILGFLGGLTLFSYKVGMEGKDAVVMIKVHLEENDYAEVVGFNKWVQDNKVPELIDTYVGKGYDALMEQVDSFAVKNNLTEFMDVGKELLMGFVRGDKKGDMDKTENEQGNPLVRKLRDLQGKITAFDFQGVIAEIEATFLLFLEHFQMKREDVLEKVKQVAQRSTDVGRRVLSSGTSMVTGGASMFFFVTSAIASGAAEVINFVTQSLVFFSVLYYLITSKTGGVMEQILEMVPLSEGTRRNYAHVLDHAVSSVLLATVKTAFFQASFTWLLLRFCGIHFLYGSTMLALVQAILPLFPSWLASLPMAVEFALNRHYIGAVLLFVIHVWVMDYGMEKIHSEIPGHNAYLTGLSIAGGMALFTPALEGAIMGPLLMTVLIAVKNLYAEFVLSADRAVD